MRLLFKSTILVIIFLSLSACTTLKRGSHTYFVVQTMPEGARVITDKQLPAGNGQIAEKYYGCAPTPCTFKLPRRSDFNVLITKPGFQPSTHIVIKERNKLVAKNMNKEITQSSTVLGTAATGLVVADLAALPVAVSTTTAVSVGAGVAVFFAIPTVGAATSIDLASGALIDLTPNPLIVELIPETSEEETKALTRAFLNTRDTNNGVKPSPPEPTP